LASIKTSVLVKGDVSRRLAMVSSSRGGNRHMAGEGGDEIGQARQGAQAAGTGDAAVATPGGDEGRLGVEVLANELAAQDFVSLQVRGTPELRERTEVRDVEPLPRRSRCGAVLDQNDPAEEGSGPVAKGALAKGRSEVDGRPDRFLGPVVEVVAERWTGLALQLDRSDEATARDDEHVPTLRRAEASG